MGDVEMGMKDGVSQTLDIPRQMRLPWTLLPRRMWAACQDEVHRRGGKMSAAMMVLEVFGQAVNKVSANLKLKNNADNASSYDQNCKH
jgi:hypothetical protein